MKRADPGADDTIRVLPAARRQRALWPFAAAALGVALVLGGSVAVWLWRPHAPEQQQALAPTPPAPPPPVAAPGFSIPTAGEAAIRDHVPAALTVFRFADNPRILVLDFPTLRQQGAMLNRVAAFVEKADAPHDRVLTDSELDAAIRSHGETAETYYFGHDYAAGSLARFFALADAQRIELGVQEETLRALLRQEGWFEPNTVAALISLPAAGSDSRITPASRAAILRHELAHGEFFSSPEYAEYVHSFWLRELSGEERGAVRRFLGREGYDVREEELMFNEMQAYLMFTNDPLFFRPQQIGMPLERLAELQERFLAGMPGGWLRAVLAESRMPVPAQ